MPSKANKKRTNKSVSHAAQPTLLYALQENKGTHSYVGVTNNFRRRLREHNGLAGKKRGARYTRRRYVNPENPNWSPIFRVTGLPTRRQALQFEKLFHRGFRGRRLITVPSKERNPFGSSAAARRAWHLYWALKKERFSRQQTVLTKHLSLKVEWLRKDFYKVARKLTEWGPGSVQHVLVSS